MQDERGNPALSGSNSPTSSSSLSFWFLKYLSGLSIPPHPPNPLAKSQGFLAGVDGRVSRILAIPPVRPKRQTPHSQAVGRDSERSLLTGTPPLPTSSPHSFLQDRQSLHFPLPVLSSLPPLARSLPLLSSSYPHLSNLRFHPPPLASPPRSRLPHPWEAPPVGQSSLYKRVPCPGAAAAGRRQLCWCGGGEPRIKRYFSGC